ncbi:MAG TPA: hypothetical protein VK894_06615 [Jiangellales bacterium]|nr:hypothetical protein [Jiangellales bacterium]
MAGSAALAVADELYGLRPGDFVAARDARAKQARQDGDRELAEAVRGLRKPTTAAWLANLLVRTEREQVDALLELGTALRDAEERLSGEELRTLTTQRRAVVASLVRRARAAARAAGQPVGEGVGWDLEATLTVALTDDRAAAALRTGRLVSVTRQGAAAAADVQAAFVDSGSPAVGATAPARPRPSDDDLARRRTRRQQEELAAARRRREEAEEAAEAAAAEYDEVAGRVAEAAEAARVAEAAVRAAAEEVAALEVRLADARDAVDVAERELAEARSARVEADGDARTSRRAREEAAAELAAARAAEASLTTPG